VATVDAPLYRVVVVAWIETGETTMDVVVCVFEIGFSVVEVGISTVVEAAPVDVEVGAT
jgi:hypothetical protein